MISKYNALQLIFTALASAALIACSDENSRGSSGGGTIGSVSQTTEEIDSLGLRPTTISRERIFNNNNPANPPVSFSIPSITIESNLTEDSAFVLSVGSPMRISVEFSEYTAQNQNRDSGLSVGFSVANYTAEQQISESLPAQNRSAPIGTWTEGVEGTEGSVNALCRVVTGDFGSNAYNCMSRFDIQGFEGVDSNFDEIGTSELHLLITVSGTANLSGGLSDGSPQLEFLTSVPLQL